MSAKSFKQVRGRKARGEVRNDRHATRIELRKVLTHNEELQPGLHGDWTKTWNRQHATAISPQNPS